MAVVQLKTSKYTDQEYLDALLKGKNPIIKEMIKDFFPRIKIYVERNNGSQDDAHDMLQTAIIALHKNMLKGNFKLTSGLYTYIHSIVRNNWLKVLNKRKQHREKEDDIRLTIVPDDTVDNEFETVRGTTGEVLRETDEDEYSLFQSKFKLLGEKCKKVLKLFFLKYSMVEIAEQMGWSSSNNAKKEKSNCQKKLVEMIRSDQQFSSLYKGKGREEKRRVDNVINKT